MLRNSKTIDAFYVLNLRALGRLFSAADGCPRSVGLNSQMHSDMANYPSAKAVTRAHSG